MGTTYGLADFVGEVRDAVRRGLPADAALRCLTPGFRRLLDDRVFLRDHLSRTGTSQDEVMLHREGECGFVVIARGVSPRGDRQGSSHAVMPHDHGPLWALYGVYEGKTRLCRYAPADGARSGDFPGLRLLEDRPAGPGEIDAVEPHHLHLPVSDPETGSVIVVVYNKPLGSVIRRGYVPNIRGLVEFQGMFPPSRVASTLPLQ